MPNVTKKLSLILSENVVYLSKKSNVYNVIPFSKMFTTVLNFYFIVSIS